MGFVSAAPLLLTFVLQYYHKEGWLSRRNLLCLWTVPIITLILAFTNAWHGWVWSGFSLGPRGANVLVYHHGYWFFIHTAYAYFLLILSFLVLLQAMLAANRRYRQQIAIFAIALSFPMVGGILYLTGWNPVPGLDWTPVGFAVTGVMVAWNISRLQFLSLVPAAREALIECMNDGIVVLDDQGRIADANPAALRLIGDKAEVFGKYWEDVSVLRQMVSPHLLQSYPQERDTSLRSPTSLRTETCLNAAPLRFFQLEITPLHDQWGLYYGHLLVMSDITSIKLSEENLRINREQLQLVIDGAPWMIAYIDAQWRYLLVNQAFANWYGLGKTECVGRSVEEVVHPNTFQQIRPYLLKVSKGDVTIFDTFVIDTDGGRHKIQTSYYPFFANDGAVQSFCAYLLDVTEQAQREARLEEAQCELQRLVNDQTQELQETIYELENEVEERQRAEATLNEMKESLVQRVTDQSRKLAGLYEVIIAGGQSDNANEVLEATLEQVKTAVEGQAVCIHQIEEDCLRLVSQRGLFPEALSQMGNLPRDWKLNLEVPYLVADLPSDEALPEPFRLTGFDSYMAAPIRRRGKEDGILSIFWQGKRIFSVEEISLISAIAEEIGVILENINLHQRIEEAATLRERRRLSRELHDSVTQSLHSLVWSAYAANNRLKQGNLDRLEVSLGQLTEGAQQALKEMRLLLYEMRLAPLKEIKFAESIQTRLEMVEQRAGIQAGLLIELRGELAQSLGRGAILHCCGSFEQRAQTRPGQPGERGSARRPQRVRDGSDR